MNIRFVALLYMRCNCMYSYLDAYNNCLSGPIYIIQNAYLFKGLIYYIQAVVKCILHILDLVFFDKFQSF